MYLYDAVYVYMTIADQVLRAGGDYRSGNNLFRQSQNRVFKGIAFINQIQIGTVEGEADS